MNRLPLQLQNNHVFITLDDALWLLDTGAPTSFGSMRRLTLAGEHFDINSNYLTLTAEDLSRFIDVPCKGLLGADVLSRFDHIFDIVAGNLTISTTELVHNGQELHIDEFMGIPIVTAHVEDSDYRMFFDTGAQISYFQHDSLIQFPPAGELTDFYPGIGRFQTDTYQVPMSLGNVSFTLRCGLLPSLLGATLMLPSVKGIIGNSILHDRIVGYFPRRHKLIL